MHFDKNDGDTILGRFLSLIRADMLALTFPIATVEHYVKAGEEVY